MSDIQNRIENVTNILQQDTARIQNLPDFVISQEDYDTIEEQADDLLGGSPAPVYTSKPNIFVQSTEPSKKDGIWLQTNKTAEHYVSDKTIILNEGWNYNASDDIAKWQYEPNNYIKQAFYCNWGDDKIVISGDIGGIKTLSYNFTTNEWTYYSNCSTNGAYSSSIAVVDDYLYMIGSGSGNYSRPNGKLNLLNPSEGWKGIKGSNSFGAACIVYNKKIYVIGSYNGGNSGYIIDTTNNDNILSNSIATAPYSLKQPKGCLIDDNIYIFSFDSNNHNIKICKYNITNNTWQSLGTLPSGWSIGSEFTTSIACVNDTIYLFGLNTSNVSNMNGVAKYNTNDNSWTEVQQCNNTLHSTLYTDYGLPTIAYNNSIYLFGQYQSPKNFVNCLQVQNKQYDDKSIVISYGRPQYYTKIYDLDLEYGFNDVWYYSTNDGLDDTIPIYYGNGTSWIKFKN